MKTLYIKAYHLRLIIFLIITTMIISNCESDDKNISFYKISELNDTLKLESGIGSKSYDLDIDSDMSFDIRFDLFYTQSHGIPSGYILIETHDSTTIAFETRIDTIWIEGGFNYVLDTFSIFKPFNLNDTLSIEQLFSNSQILVSKLIGEHSSGGNFTEINNGFKKDHFIVFKKRIKENETYYGWILIYQESNYNMILKEYGISNNPINLQSDVIVINRD